MSAVNKFLFVLVCGLAVALYVEVAKGRKLGGVKDLVEKQLTATVTQLKLTNQSISDRASELTKLLDKTNKEKAAILIRLNSIVKESSKVSEQRADNTYRLYLDNNKPSPELGKIILLPGEQVHTITNQFYINSEILVAASPASNEENQYRVLVSSSFVSQAEGTEYYNKPYLIEGPTGETFIKIPTNRKDYPNQFYIKPLNGAYNLGLSTHGGPLLTKTLFGYSDLNLLSVGVAVSQGKGIDFLAELISFRPFPKSLLNTRVGLSVIPAQTMPALSLSVEL